MSYIFGGNTGNSYDDIKRIRQQANAIKPTGQIRGGINGFGEGLSTLGRALMYRNMNKKADTMEQQGREQFNQQFAAWQQPKEMMVASTEPMASGMPPRDPQAELIQLSELAHSPYASKGQQTALQLLLQQKIEGMKPEDPMKQVQLEKAKLELDQMRNPQRNIVTGADGYQYYQDDGSRVLPNVQRQEDPMKALQLEKTQLELDRLKNPNSDVKGVSVDGNLVNPYTGEVIYQGEQNAEKLNKNQVDAAGFSDRMIESENVLRGLEGSGTSFWNNIGSQVPFGNHFVSEDFQKYDQAKRNFINAVLRRESGAAIGDSEFENANKQYFPMPGDSDSVVEQKRLNRENTMRGIQRGAGESYQAPELAEYQPQESARVGRRRQSRNQTSAPAEAIAMLKQNPQMAEAFKSKYGYLPEGM